MYKFNYLLSINSEKVNESQRKRVVNLVFFLSLIVSLLFMGLLYLNTNDLYSVNENLLKKQKDIKSKIKKFRSDKEYFKHNIISSIYNIQDNRIIWTDLFYEIEELLGEKAIIEEVHYNSDRLTMKLLLKAEENTQKADISGLLISYKDELSNSTVFKKYLSEDVYLSSGPDKGMETKIKDKPAFLWSFEFVFELNPVLKFKGKGTKKRKKKSRFN